jgi:hypothetical protein
VLITSLQRAARPLCGSRVFRSCSRRDRVEKRALRLAFGDPHRVPNPARPSRCERVLPLSRITRLGGRAIGTPARRRWRPPLTRQRRATAHFLPAGAVFRCVWPPDDLRRRATRLGAREHEHGRRPRGRFPLDAHDRW